MGKNSRAGEKQAVGRADQVGSSSDRNRHPVAFIQDTPPCSDLEQEQESY